MWVCFFPGGIPPGMATKLNNLPLSQIAESHIEKSRLVSP